MKNGGEVVEPNDKKEEENTDGSDENKVEEIKTTIYYVTDEVQQSQYINLFKQSGTWMRSMTQDINIEFIHLLDAEEWSMRSS
ncbi:MAG: hypothetical protein ACLTT1_11455 [[Clostridium] scindens]